MRIIETYFLVDYENVHGDGLSGCENLCKTDHIVIFFTRNARNIDMSEISDHGDAELEMIEVPVGKQSADMHIGSYLGFLAGENGKNRNVVIVSRDTDFDNIIKFWKEKTGIKASRAQQIKKKPVPKISTGIKKSIVPKNTFANINSIEKTKLNQETMQAVRNAGYDASVANKVAQVATQFYGNERMLSEVHNALRKQYSDYLDMYNIVKPVLSKYADVVLSKSGISMVTARNNTALNTEIMKLLSKSGYSNDIVAYVASAAVKNFGVKNGKQHTYRTIISKYGQNTGLAIYNQIRKLI